MKQETPIEIDKMVDSIFENTITEDLIDEITEERNFIINTLKHFIETDEVWEQCANDKRARKLLLNNLQTLFLQEMENSAIIELATISEDDIKP